MSIELKITGMTCLHCVKAVRAALEAVPGVTAALVALEDGSARVEGSPDPEALIRAVVADGYQAELVSGSAEHQLGERLRTR